jgi:hypothetical protein
VEKLGKNHQRTLSVGLAHIDEEFYCFGMLANCQAAPTPIFELKNNLLPEQVKKLVEEIRKIREYMRQMRDELGLQPTIKSVKVEIGNRCSELRDGIFDLTFNREGSKQTDGVGAFPIPARNSPHPTFARCAHAVATAPVPRQPRLKLSARV